MTAPQDDEFGPWQTHDGKGCPCVGHYVERELTTEGLGVTKSGQENWTVIGVVPQSKLAAWDWSNFAKMKPNGMLTPKVTRYRIRKPRALLDLIQLIADLPAPTQPMKTDGVIA